MKQYTVYLDEFYTRAITMRCDKPLAAHPYAQAGVTCRGDNIALWSYATNAAEINSGWLSVTCLCSNTTRKHVSWFLREYCPQISYATARKLFRSGDEINIYTGELREAIAV